MMSLSHLSNNMVTATCLIKMNTVNHLEDGFRLKDINIDYYARISNLIWLQSVKLLLKRLNLSGIGIILLNGKTDIMSLSHLSKNDYEDSSTISWSFLFSSEWLYVEIFRMKQTKSTLCQYDLIRFGLAINEGVGWMRR